LRSLGAADARRKRFKPGTVREEATLDQLDQAFRQPASPADHVVQRIRQWAARDAEDLELELQRRAEVQKQAAIKQLTAVGETEAKSLKRLLEDQSAKIARADAEPDDRQLSFLPEIEAEAEQRRRDRRHWKDKLARLAKDIEQEPERVRRAYSVAADRLETIGLVYLWPVSN
jgi:hypothetical protein